MEEFSREEHEGAETGRRKANYPAIQRWRS